MEKKEAEIFNTYALMRLSESNPMFSDFPSEASESLAYLSSKTGIALLPNNDTYLKRETDQFGETQKYYAENITQAELIAKRAKNIEQLTTKLSPVVAQKIKQFEEYTKYLHAPDLISKEDLAKNLKKSISLFSGKDPFSPKTRIIINKKIHDLTDQKFTTQQQKTSEKKEQKKVLFYNTLQQIHQPHSNDESIVLYGTLLKNITAQDYDDVPSFGKTYYFDKTPNAKKKRISAQKTQIRTELKRDIAEQMYKLYRADLRKEAGWWKQELDAYEEACAHYTKRILGPKGAFASGGIYGPDSRFANPTQNTNSNTPPSPPPLAASMEPLDNPKDVKQEKYIGFSLFSNKDFEY